MQKSYEKPEIEIFAVQNVIALSAAIGDDNIAQWDFGGTQR